MNAVAEYHNQLLGTVARRHGAQAAVDERVRPLDSVSTDSGPVTVLDQIMDYVDGMTEETARVSDIAPRHLSEEGRSVLGEVEKNLRKDGARDYLLRGGSAEPLQGGILSLRWVASDHSHGFATYIHETPGVPGGLLYMEPLHQD